MVAFCRVIFPVSNFDQLLTIEVNNFFLGLLQADFSQKILVKTVYMTLSISLTRKCLVSFNLLMKEFHQPFF